MTKEEAKKFGLQLLHGIMERNGSYPVYANNVKQAIEALSEPNGNLEEAAKMIYPRKEGDLYSLHSTLQRAAFKVGASWQKEQDEKELSEKIASAYQLGLADKEKHMMKDAVEGEVDEKTFGYKTIRPNLKQLDIILETLSEGDKVKLIIIKEEGK